MKIRILGIKKLTFLFVSIFLMNSSIQGMDDKENKNPEIIEKQEIDSNHPKEQKRQVTPPARQAQIVLDFLIRFYAEYKFSRLDDLEKYKEKLEELVNKKDPQAQTLLDILNKYGSHPLTNPFNKKTVPFYSFEDGTGIAFFHGKSVYIIYGGMYAGVKGAGKWDYIVTKDGFQPDPETEKTYWSGESQSKMCWAAPVGFLTNNPNKLPGKLNDLSSSGVHLGFQLRFKQSWDGIYRSISEYALGHGMKPSDLNYFVIGHSMGGGVAQLAALRLATVTFSGKPVTGKIKVFTFGAPSIFSPALVDGYNDLLGEHTFTIVHQGDLMPEYGTSFTWLCQPGTVYITPELQKGYRQFTHSDIGYKLSINAWINTPLESQPLGSNCSKAKRVANIFASCLKTPVRCVTSTCQWLFGKKYNFIEYELEKKGIETNENNTNN